MTMLEEALALKRARDEASARFLRSLSSREREIIAAQAKLPKPRPWWSPGDDP